MFRTAHPAPPSVPLCEPTHPPPPHPRRDPMIDHIEDRMELKALVDKYATESDKGN